VRFLCDVQLSGLEFVIAILIIFNPNYINRVEKMQFTHK
jgi:hypothetical protein